MLVRLQRLMLLRQTLGDRHLDELAPSWIIGPPGAPGRWWGLVLVATPLLLSAHAAFVALRDGDLFITPVGERSIATMGLYGAVYVAIVVAGLVQLRALYRHAASPDGVEGARQPI